MTIQNGTWAVAAWRRGRGWLSALAVLAACAAAGSATLAQTPPPAPTGGASPSAGAGASSPALPESWISAFTWRSIGPANMGGRITALAVYEKDPNIWYAATASGGLLKTVNNGVTFEHQFDHEATVSIGDAAVAQSNPDIVWVGTGEHNPRNSSSWGDGVYKSTDGGKTWKNMGLRKGFQTGRIAIHPTDPNIVYVGVAGRLWGTSDERGLYKTIDGGETWERILYVDDKTGVIDVQMKPGYPDTLLVATYERQRDGFDTNEPAKRNGPGSGLWRTTDAGKTFTKMTEGLPTSNLGRMGIEYYRKNPDVVYLVIESDKTGQEPPNAPYIGLRGADAEVGAKITDVTKGGPAEAAGLKADDIVLAVNGASVHSYNAFLAEVRKRIAGDTIKVSLSRNREPVEAEVKLTTRPAPTTAQRARDGTGRRTDDTGSAGTFSSGLGGQRGNLTEQQGPDGHEYGGVYKSTDGGESWTRINSINPRPMYFSQVRADPNDDNFMWVLGVTLDRSKDNGKTFTSDGGRGTHADGHAMWIDPRDGRHIIYGNDGGIYVTYDRGENWDHLNHVAIGQFYHVAVDPRPNYMVYGGLQDNGSWGGPSRTRAGRGPINEDWISIGGGDGFVCRVDPEDPDQVYYESQGGAMGRFNFRTGERGSIRPPAERGIRYRFNWKTPFLLSSHNSKIFYAGAQYVFRSLDKGRTVKRISDEFTRTARGSATAIAESPLDSDVLYAGSDDGALIGTRNGGMTWYKLVDFPLTEAEKNAQAVVEESESGGGGGGGAEPAAPSPIAAAPAEAPAAPAPAEAAPVRAEQTAGEATSQPAEGGRGPGGGFGERMVERLKEMDSNADGKVARSEVPEQMVRMFERADANSDGVIDEEEMKALAQRMSSGRGGPGGPGGGQEGSARGGQERPARGEQDAPARPAGPGRGGPAREAAAPPAPEPAGPRPGQILSLDPPKAPEPPAVPALPPAEDPLTGEWTAKMTGEELPQGMAEFKLSLTLAAGGRVVGSYDSSRGGGTISDGKFDIEKGMLAATAVGERSEVTINGKLTEGKLAGEIELFGGRFTVPYEAQRTSTTPATPAPVQSAAEAGQPLTSLLPGARWVSSIETSRYKAGRVYVTFDGHRSDDDEPYVFVSEDYGTTWRSIRANLPTSAGSVKVLREDIQKEDLLYLGTEFGAYVSVDRGVSWTRFNNNLPTVAVHEFALHPTSGEIIAATHGRSLWILDVTPLRQMSDKTAGETMALFTPRNAVYWRPDPRRGGDNRRFVGENDDSNASIVYSLSRPARSISLQVTDAAGEVVRVLEPKAEAGLHRVVWDLRRAAEAPQGAAGGRGPGGAGGGGGGGFGGGGRGRLVPSGTYRVALKVDGETLTRNVMVQGDPQFPDYQPWAQGGGFGAEEEFEEKPEEDGPLPLDRDD